MQLYTTGISTEKMQLSSHKLTEITEPAAIDHNFSLLHLMFLPSYCEFTHMELESVKKLVLYRIEKIVEKTQRFVKTWTAECI